MIKKIIEKKQDSELFNIKPTQNAFDILYGVLDRSTTFHNNWVFMINYFQKCT